ARWAPASSLYGGVNHVGSGEVLIQATSEDAWDRKAPGIKKYGVAMKPHPDFDSPSRIRLASLKGWPAPLAANTPGLVWDVQDGSSVVLVTVDGGRYEIHHWPSDFDKVGPLVDSGAGSPTAWPAPLQHSLVDVGVVSTLGKVGAVPKASAD